MASVHETCFKITAGEEGLALYRWNAGIAIHYFCSVCGIYPFHRKRSMPGHYGINVKCLDGFDASSLRIVLVEGRKMSAVSAKDSAASPRLFLSVRKSEQ